MKLATLPKNGFTLIELSVVLVIIGLIVGAIVAGRDMIEAAAVRAQISQIQKYNSAVTAFYNKYSALPGDMRAAQAADMGFGARGAFLGEGDGNGVIEGPQSVGGQGNNHGYVEAVGETAAFWADLSTAGMIEGRFVGQEASYQGGVGVTFNSTPYTIQDYFPQAKIGQGNYVYVWSGGVMSPWNANGINYFGIGAVTALDAWAMTANPGLSASQAAAIDAKIDDGLPQSGNVTATYIANNVCIGGCWAGGPGTMGANTGATAYGPTAVATPATSTTCYDNRNLGGTQQYSTGVSGGNAMNCALSFQFN